MGNRKTLVGNVVSNKMDKTVVVMVTTRRQHPRYKKYIEDSRKFKAHDEANACNVGDRVKIVETRPLSREKRWRVAEVLPEEAVTEILPEGSTEES
ncbi:30S ribosomal protein S17 [Dehalococcoidia bacterium]|nr:30S ribosomal protein S17 [Dehalococcoidia bacterium]